MTDPRRIPLAGRRDVIRIGQGLHELFQEAREPGPVSFGNAPFHQIEGQFELAVERRVLLFQIGLKEKDKDISTLLQDGLERVACLLPLGEIPFNLSQGLQYEIET
jgi:hypothetical protein